MNDKIEALERLAKLAEDGRISEEEYGSLKQEVLDSGQRGGALEADTPGPSLDTTERRLRGSADPDTTRDQDHSGDGPTEASSGEPAAHREASEADKTDMYEVALAKATEPTAVGWYPDPENLGTHVRYYEGNRWTDETRKRKPPDWYLDPDRPNTHQRYYDGLNFTDEYRKLNLDHLAGPPTISERSKDWRFWVGLVLVILGVLAVFSTYAVTGEDPQGFSSEAFAFNLAIHPLIWGGLAGWYLLMRWKRDTD